MKATLRIECSELDNDYCVVLDCCPGLSAFGDTKEEALHEFAVALLGYMEVLIEDGDKLNER